MASIKGAWRHVGGYTEIIKHLLACLLLCIFLLYYQPPLYQVYTLVTDYFPWIRLLINDSLHYLFWWKRFTQPTYFPEGEPFSWRLTWIWICNGLALFTPIYISLNILSFLTCPMFTKSPNLRYPISSAPFLCIRVCTTGSYPDLVKSTVKKNAVTCLQLGLPPSRFSIEVVTSTSIGLTEFGGDDDVEMRRVNVREIVVPDDYKLANGSIFKCRNLQYGLEADVNQLVGGDYILHLDEETLLTASSLISCINSMCEGRLDFAQGLVTYASYGRIKSCAATVFDLIRVAIDYGGCRFFLTYYECCFFNWKGSWVLSKYSSEVKIGYDHGKDYSIAEDCYFALLASSLNYKLGWLEGEMIEESPHSLWDFFKQRQRWFLGINYILLSATNSVKFKYKFGLALYYLGLPTSNLVMLISMIYLEEMPLFAQICFMYMGRLQGFMLTLGMIKSFDLKRDGLLLYSSLLVAALFTPILSYILGSFALWSAVYMCLRHQHSFYEVMKEPAE